MSERFKLRWGALALLALLLPTTADAGGLSPQEQRGKQIYTQGTSQSGEPISARLGSLDLPGAAATCASCHGPDGRGRPEAGVIPSDVTWGHLLKPYGHSHPMGRRHPTFTVESLKHVIVTGRDPAGNALDASMPVYAMSDADLDDLVAYLRRLTTDLDPGLSQTALRIGTVLPAGGALAAIGQGIRDVLEARFDDVNATGGLYGRRLELMVSSYDDANESPLEAARGLLEGGDVFALLSPVVIGADAEIGALAESLRVPVIGPLTLLSADPLTLNDFTFYLFSGLREQVRVLVDFAAGELGLESPRAAVLAPSTGRAGNLHRAIAEQLAVHAGGGVPPLALTAGDTDAGSTARRLAGEGVEALFVLARAELGALLAAGEEIGWRPYVLLPGALLAPEIFDLPATFQDRVHLSFPTIPSDTTRAGAVELEALLDGHGLKLRHRASQVSALAATKVLTVALRGAGRDLSRGKLLRSLERLYQLETGWTPPLTYGANRRVGALGAYVVAVDLENKALIPTGGWLSPK